MFNIILALLLRLIYMRFLFNILISIVTRFTVPSVISIPGLESLGCIYLESNHMSWDNAQKNCQVFGGSLMNVESDDQYNTLKNYLGK